MSHDDNNFGGSLVQWILENDDVTCNPGTKGRVHRAILIIEFYMFCPFQNRYQGEKSPENGVLSVLYIPFPSVLFGRLVKPVTAEHPWRLLVKPLTVMSVTYTWRIRDKSTEGYNPWRMETKFKKNLSFCWNPWRPSYNPWRIETKFALKTTSILY